MLGLPFAFALPAVLFGLIALPAIWWLLRLTPPKPETEVFPPLRILQKLVKREETPAKSPWWLTLLRLALAALVIFALARPLLNPQTEMALEEGPLLIMVDNSWASASDWQARQRTGAALIQSAGERGIPVAISPSVSPPSATIRLVDAATAAASFATLEPVAAEPNRAQALGRLSEAALGSENATLAILSDGLAQLEQDSALNLDANIVSKTLLFNGEITQVAAISEAQNRTNALEATIIRSQNSQLADEINVNAIDEKGRLLGTATAFFEDGASEAIAAFEVPFELRNDMATLRIENQKNAAATYMLDENNRRRRFALFSGLAGDEDQPLLSPLYYIARAIQPYADIVRPRSNDLSVDIPEILEQGPAVIIMADIGVLPNVVEGQIEEWIEAGGTLVRFAGPRLAASADDDPFLPVSLRSGERELGGALTWTEPQIVAPFSANGPFAELDAPRDVTVNRQLLANPDAQLAEKTWASLQDGTPLVTGERRGKGTIVLFHVTAEATWSNLPISGSFVDMLRRVADISANTGASDSTSLSATGEALSPLRTLRSDGELINPPSFVKPRDTASTAVTTYENPAGLYGTQDAFSALNILNTGATLEPFVLPQTEVPTETLPYAVAEETDLSGWLFAIAFLLLIIDTLAMLWINGRFKRSYKSAGASAALLIAIAAISFAPSPTHAQDAKPGDELLIENLDATRIGYVLTGRQETDTITKAGISGISRYLASRTALEPSDPVGLDIETDALAIYPLIYFPIDADADMPSETAIARLDAYMQAGGSILFDTRDQIGGSFSSGQSPENQRLRDIMRNLNVPPLEPMPADHVLTKSFYILDSFPGVYDGSPLWVQASNDENNIDRPVRSGDGVSPILITGNDLAGAWALDESGVPLRPIASGNPMQRIYAFRTGVNIMMYMLTGNYKADQVHIPALLERLGQ
ncbi:DUF4159 domain-containing protein [Ahrensia kielensis]|uniref:DUF4159 domain-containing protein n=1 Tax=Ahrensia kielensis TaxID=76980 RepID=A0ABU9T606_9HYPH